jgi:hypothetical protein
MDCIKTLLTNISCLGPFKAEYILRFVFVPMLSLSPSDSIFTFNFGKGYDADRRENCANNGCQIQRRVAWTFNDMKKKIKENTLPYGRYRES